MEEKQSVKCLEVEEAKAGDKWTPVCADSLGKQKTGRRNKKDSLKDKKKLKNLERQEKMLNIADLDPLSIKNKSDEDNSVTTHDSGLPSSKTVKSQIQHHQSNLLNRIINKPPYVSVSASGKLSGDFGHSSGIWKRPLIEGNFFLEVMVREECFRQKKTAFKSSVRVGICHHAFNPAFPLGIEESIAYKSCDGSFFRNGEKVAQGQSYAVNDVIGILMKISPPHKWPQPNQINEDSSVSFFKNGRLIWEFKDLKQVFYCFGVSFFNYSQVEVLQGPDSRYPMPIDAKHYYAALDEPILYKDLENNKIFKI